MFDTNLMIRADNKTLEKRPEPKIKTGFLGTIYTHIVESADKGCILKVR